MNLIIVQIKKSLNEKKIFQMKMTKKVKMDIKIVQMNKKK